MLFARYTSALANDPFPILRAGIVGGLVASLGVEPAATVLSS